jgi:hypothetical protein
MWFSSPSLPALTVVRHFVGSRRFNAFEFRANTLQAAAQMVQLIDSIQRIQKKIVMNSRKARGLNEIADFCDQVK